MQKAIVTTEGLFQSVHITWKDFTCTARRFYVKRVGKSVLLIPEDADPWDLLEESLERFTEDFMAKRSQPPQQQREGLSA